MLCSSDRSRHDRPLRLPCRTPDRRACRSFLKEAKEIGGWDIVWAPGPPPDEPERSKTCTVAVPMHLRQEEPVGTYSYGHMLRDNFYFLVTIPRRFATSASAFAWVTYPRTEGNNAKWRLPILNKINALLSPHQDRRWFEVEKSCREEANPLGAGERDSCFCTCFEGSC